MEPETGPPASELYLLCGLAFSGKMTLAAALAHHLGVAVVRLDEINASSTRCRRPGSPGISEVLL